ncbi:MAG: peroxiredoxin [Nitrosomonas sp.]|nr:MAG: peroxiredoxin [Nitrosomonas sp.]
MIKLDHPVGNFVLPTTGGGEFSLANHLGKTIVIYFYPKDDTPGCTTEGQDFRDHWTAFTEKNCIVVGVSRDALDSHEQFKAKMGFPFELLSDTNEKVCDLFGVMKMKNMYGKQVRGIERSTFVVDAQGILRREWRGVKVPGHVKDVFDCIAGL